MLNRDTLYGMSLPNFEKLYKIISIPVVVVVAVVTVVAVVAVVAVVVVAVVAVVVVCVLVSAIVVCPRTFRSSSLIASCTLEYSTAQDSPLIISVITLRNHPLASDTHYLNSAE